MNKTKFFIGIILAVSVLIAQIGSVSAAPASQNSIPVIGTVQSITLETDPNTGVITVLVGVTDQNLSLQSVRMSLETASTLGLFVLDDDGNHVINNAALGESIEIDPTTVIPEEIETRHPVGNALAAFFSDIAGVDYDTIMAAHDQGIGFGVIAQALWLTLKLEGNAEVFQALLHAKEIGDYTNFAFDKNGTRIIPKNWAELRKAIMAGEKMDNLGTIMSAKDKSHANKDDGNSNSDGNGHGNGKDKDKSNNGHGNNNGQGNGNSK